MNIIHIKILISKTYVKGLYHILWKTGEETNVSMYVCMPNVTMVAFPNSFCQLTLLIQ